PCSLRDTDFSGQKYRAGLSQQPHNPDRTRRRSVPSSPLVRSPSQSCEFCGSLPSGQNFLKRPAAATVPQVWAVPQDEVFPNTGKGTSVQTSDIVKAWGRILNGERPSLSIEITRECPLRCPGCYAYEDGHLGGGITLRGLRDRKGQELVDGVLEVVDGLRPLHLSLVGGDPLVRYRELETMVPLLLIRGIHVQIV